MLGFDITVVTRHVFYKLEVEKNQITKHSTVTCRILFGFMLIIFPNLEYLSYNYIVRVLGSFLRAPILRTNHLGIFRSFQIGQKSQYCVCCQYNLGSRVCVTTKLIAKGCNAFWKLSMVASISLVWWVVVLIRLLYHFSPYMGKAIYDILQPYYSYVFGSGFLKPYS